MDLKSFMKQEMIVTYQSATNCAISFKFSDMFISSYRSSFSFLLYIPATLVSYHVLDFP